MGASHPRKRNDAQKSDRGEIPMSDGVDKKINGLWPMKDSHFSVVIFDFELSVHLKNTFAWLACFFTIS